MHRSRVELAISRSRFRRPNHYTNEPPCLIRQTLSATKYKALRRERTSHWPFQNLWHTAPLLPQPPPPPSLVLMTHNRKILPSCAAKREDGYWSRSKNLRHSVLCIKLSCGQSKGWSGYQDEPDGIDMLTDTIGQLNNNSSKARLNRADVLQGNIASSLDVAAGKRHRQFETPSGLDTNARFLGTCL